MKNVIVITAQIFLCTALIFGPFFYYIAMMKP